MQGYKKKPLLIEIFALLYLLNPVGNMLYFFYWNQNIPIIDIPSVLWHYIFLKGNILLGVNIFLWLSAIPLAYGLFKVRLWAWYYFLIHSVSMVVLSLFKFDGTFGFTIASAINLLFLIPIGYFISKEVRAPYFNPRLRWWEQSKRFVNEVKVIIDTETYKTFDLSTTGAFIVQEGNQKGLSAEKFIPAEIDFGAEKIFCPISVRWATSEETTHPAGWGVKFEQIGGKERAMIKKYINELIQSGKTERR